MHLLSTLQRTSRLFQRSISSSNSSQAPPESPEAAPPMPSTPRIASTTTIGIGNSLHANIRPFSTPFWVLVSLSTPILIFAILGLYLWLMHRVREKRRLRNGNRVGTPKSVEAGAGVLRPAVLGRDAGALQAGGDGHGEVRDSLDILKESDLGEKQRRAMRKEKGERRYGRYFLRGSDEELHWMG
ncbi:hypothetical protein EJ05DRAFT_480408 [Pseudovirgaria hyperparasitica]|uniref:Uncharacterized protein n=1 Tax=Pseudovirgaria hyperparasitica TaxID=470096 RepID=A0A6A6VUI3_9PEZI|nr:uncharacterized protein EJ05DRAFT_480408 [Pseudovirgaria hyperparasitica]KAF2753394.1 hypothetical protein EJ05DRAFT_480408 [Pseudovirgaria hyperparasitica]